MRTVAMMPQLGYRRRTTGLVFGHRGSAKRLVNQALHVVLHPANRGIPLPVWRTMIEAESVGVNTPPSAPQASPIRRRLATLFVDIAGSTSLLIHDPPVVVLGVVRAS